MDDLDTPPFPHAPSGSCVVFAERLPDEAGCNPTETRLMDVDVGLWSGDRDNPSVRPKTTLVGKTSEYLSDWDRGVMAEPQGLICVPKANVESTPNEKEMRVSTKPSTKQPWVGASLDGVIESAALMPLLRPQGLRPFHLEIDAYLIAPLVRSSDGLLELPNDVDDPRFGAIQRTRALWLEAERVYGRRRTSKAGKTLLENLDWMGKLTKQLLLINGSSSQRRRKVVYNKSGKLELRATRCAQSTIVNGSLYWMLAQSEAEALYLCGVINAKCLQSAWRSSKTSKLHFDKNPWRTVPVPKFDRSDATHVRIVEAAKSAERSASRGIDWQTTDCGTALDDAVRTLLPAYTSTSA